ncbi:hypothetical protein [uncultured Winogradskyella sp.]|uniref:hypothetical protein n=1 Tax=uncultured Winogradskyella sp. TaxID=395353 RepID=UPI00262F9266|nr:hypothetical protein [uncultured Winogradskyella sp.]
MRKNNNFIEKNWPIAIGLLLFFTGILLTSLHFGSSSKQAVRDATLGLLLSLLLKVIYRLHSYQDKVEKQKDLVEKFIRLLSQTPKIGETVSLTYEINERKDRFYDFFLENILDQYNYQLKIIQRGKYRCNASNELLVTKKVLECCNNNLKAISYQDEKWWTSHEGTLYLKAHEQNIDRKKEKAIRIFLIESSSINSFKDIFKKHLELGIEIYVIYVDKDNIDAKYLIDFVIYDDYILRKANESINQNGGKEALFTTELSEVNKYCNYFENILTIARTLRNKIPQ